MRINLPFHLDALVSEVARRRLSLFFLSLFFPEPTLVDRSRRGILAARY